MSINSVQSVRLEKGTTEFKNYFKQIPVPFKVYANFECNLESAESYEGSYPKKYQITFLVVLLTNLFLLMINLVRDNPIVVFRGKNDASEFIEAIVKKYEYCKKIMKKTF